MGELDLSGFEYGNGAYEKFLEELTKENNQGQEIKKEEDKNQELKPNENSSIGLEPIDYDRKIRELEEKRKRRKQNRLNQDKKTHQNDTHREKRIHDNSNSFNGLEKKIESFRTNDFSHINFINFASGIIGLLKDYEPLIKKAKKEHEEYLNNQDEESNHKKGKYLQAFETNHQKFKNIIKEIGIKELSETSYEIDTGLNGLVSDWNYKKRSEKYKQLNFDQYQTLTLMSELSDFLRGIERIRKCFYDEEYGTEAFKDIDTYYEKLIDYMSDFGLVVVDDINVNFNEELHEAIDYIEGFYKEDGNIIEVIEKGYFYRPSVTYLQDEKSVMGNNLKENQSLKKDIMLKPARVVIYKNMLSEKRDLLRQEDMV